MMKTKRGIAMGFNWIFALVVGSIILVLAIYGATKFVSTGERVGQSENAAVIVSVLDSVEAGLGDGKSSEINFRKDVEIMLDCDELSNRPFGKQSLQIGDGIGAEIKNKYVFSEQVINGKDVYVFSKPFYLGYKVADIIILSTEEYCFVDIDNEIKYELMDLNSGNVKFAEYIDECSENSLSVCSSDNCDVQIIGDYNFGKVISIPFQKNVNLIDGLNDNLKLRLHTLFLLDLNPKEDKFLSINEALKRLKEQGMKNQLVVGIERLGYCDQKIKAGNSDDLIKFNFNKFPQCLIVPGKMHFLEEEVLGIYK